MAAATPSVPVIGIDLGTSKACAAVVINGQIRIVTNEYGNRFIPCYVYFGDGKRSIGEDAERNASMGMKNTVHQIKRLIGRYGKNTSGSKSLGPWGFDVRTEKGRPQIKVDYRSQRDVFSPEEISAIILNKLKKMAEKLLETSIKDAVISVPVDFNDGQRTATRDAGLIAGFKKVHLINDTTAAALAYEDFREKKSPEDIIVFDLGAGCFNVSVCEIREGNLDVIASRGNSRLGGNDIDKGMIKHFAKEITDQCGIDIFKDRKAASRLRHKCERAKKVLSGSNDARVQVEEDFASTITRNEFNELNKYIFEEIFDTVSKVLGDAERLPRQINRVVLVGGSSRIPKVRETLLRIFEDERKLSKTLNADEAVVHGATIYAQNLRNSEKAKQKNYGFTEIFTRAVYMKDKRGNRKEVIQLKSTIPCHSVLGGHQPSIQKYMICEENLKGEVDKLGTCLLGKSEEEIKLNCSQCGILSVTDSKTNSFTKTGVRLSKTEIEVMIHRIKDMEKEDQEWVEKTQARNSLEKLAYAIKQLVRNSTDCKITAQQEKEILGECEQVLGWLETNADTSVEDCTQKQSELSTTQEKLKHFQEQQLMQPAQQPDSDKTKERNRRKARLRFQNAIAKVLKETKQNPEKKNLYRHALDLDDWLEDNPKESMEEYEKRRKELMKMQKTPPTVNENGGQENHKN